MLTIKNLRFAYPKANFISFPDWHVTSGEAWTLHGRSGSGKTTLFHLVSGILLPESGDIGVGDVTINRLSERARDRFRGQQIGIVFQTPHLLSYLTVSENVAMARRLAGLPADPSMVRRALSALGIAGMADRYPSQLSQGQLQRVSVARAKVNKPKLLLADEPTSSLDDVQANLAIDLLLEISRHSGSMLLVATHDQRVRERITNTYYLSP